MIRRIIYVLSFGAVWLTACEKEPTVSIALSQTEVLLSCEQGAQTTCRITASGAWTLILDGADFEATPLSGEAGESLLTVTATSENPGTFRRTLGRIELRPLGRGEMQRIEVRQRPAVAPRSFFFFFIGTSLQEFFNANLQAALSAMDGTMLGDGRVAAFYRNVSDRGKVWEIAELHYDAARRQGVMTTVERFEEIDRSDPAFITGVIEKMKSHFPAREYGLAFGGHGSGWLPVGSSIYGPGVAAGTLAERKKRRTVIPSRVFTARPVRSSTSTKSPMLWRRRARISIMSSSTTASCRISNRSMRCAIRPVISSLRRAR